MTRSVSPRPAGRPPRVQWWHPYIQFERRGQPLLPWPKFFGRLFRNSLLAFAVIGVSWLLGIVGYHAFAHLSWIDSVLNASMILTGMGPVDRLTTVGAKWFASTYALYSGVMFLSSIGLLLAPIAHRFLHRFHLEEEGEQG